jgi:hypothetical protein
MAGEKLVIRELREIASVPNGLDEKILLQIQENLAVDVMRLYKADFVGLMQRQKAAATPPDEALRERNEFFARTLQNEYRNRVHNGNGFSLPLYVETAENFYRLEVGRHLQEVKDYLAHGKTLAETYQAQGVYELRSRDPEMRDMAHRVADSLNSINDSLEKLRRVKIQAAASVAETLRQEMTSAINKLHGDGFSQALLAEASTLADAKRQLAAMEKDTAQFSIRRP